MCHHAKSTKATGTGLIKNAHIKNQIPSTTEPTTMVAWTQGEIKQRTLRIGIGLGCSISLSRLFD